MSWHSQGNCVGSDPSLFFPERGNITAVRAALAVCADCPVVEPCLQEALLDLELEGIRGGTTGQERRNLRRTMPNRECRRTCRECEQRYIGDPKSSLCSDECRRERDLRQKREARRSA